MPVLVLGSIALDSVKTPLASHTDLLGGSASYAAVAASFFHPVRIVGIVGEDFPEKHLTFFRSKGIDLEGLQIVPGKTFRWAGEYHWDLNTRDTLSTELNVFEHFTPTLPASYTDARFLMLANISPDLQNHVLNQVKNPLFTIADTMDLWINIAKPEVLRLLGRIDMLILNDSEARHLTGETSLIKAAGLIRAMGPRFLVIKKGEHGALLFGPDNFFSCGAYPLEDIHDPTGAGDTFAGGLAGYLASLNPAEVKFEHLRKAVVFASVLASFNVESFSMDRMQRLTLEGIEARYAMFKAMSEFEVLS